MAEKELPTPEEMQEMAEIDIRTVGRLKIRIAISPME